MIRKMSITSSLSLFLPPGTQSYTDWYNHIHFAKHTVFWDRIAATRPVEIHLNFFECRKMIFCKPGYFFLLLNLLFCGCGTQLALSGQAREDYLKSIKAYGEYFVKPGASREEWQRDWLWRVA